MPKRNGHGVLEKMAYLIDDMVQGLHLFPVGRQPCRQVPVDGEHNDSLCRERLVARSRIYIPYLGCSPRPVHDYRAPNIRQEDKGDR